MGCGVHPSDGRKRELKSRSAASSAALSPAAAEGLRCLVHVNLCLLQAVLRSPAIDRAVFESVLSAAHSSLQHMPPLSLAPLNAAGEALGLGAVCAPLFEFLRAFATATTATGAAPALLHADVATKNKGPSRFLSSSSFLCLF